MSSGIASIANVSGAMPALRIRAMSGRKQVQQCWCRPANLFDHLVGAGQERRGHVKAERLGGLEIDN